MFRDFFSSRAILAGLVFFVLTVCSSLLYSWHVRSSSQEAAEQTKEATQQLAEKNRMRAAEEKPPPSGETAQSGHWHGDVWHSTPDTLPQEPTHRQVVDAYEPQDNTDVNFPETEVDTDISWAETAEAEQLTQKLFEDWDAYALTLKDKYPVLSDSDAIMRIAQTKEGRDKLKSQIEAMLNDSLDEFERLFSQLPTEFASQVMDMVEEQFEQDSRGIPPQYVKEAIDIMRARIR